MSDEAPQSTPQEHQPAGDGATSPRVSLDKPTGEQAAQRAPWSAPGQDTGPAPVQDAIPASHQDSGAPGDSVHHQQTVTSLPAAPDGSGAATPPASWAPPAPAAPNPFAPPAAPPPANPYAPPATAAHPYAPPVPPAPAGPYASQAAPQAGPEPVPPPPIAPDGPAQVPYGYPGPPSAYGYPGQPQPPTPYPGPYPAAQGYGWPGMQPMPSNGMGTTSLVLGIVSAVCFLLWPIALVLGILAVIFGALGRGKAKRGEATNPGVALAGLICGGAGIVLVLVFFALLIAVTN
ncbi:DUF4190 domain-containing protein [Streptomyces sp. NPDC052109]|uniref:DUF4190 domain-containing protein n=1 Tax=Streptomyces sp. NPDC052109 TaxID=3155527 RepID=UPI003449673A